MKKLILVLAFAISLSAQAVRVDPQPATTVASNVPVGALTPVLAIPGAQITLCGYPAAGGLPCTNYATTYTTLAAGATCPSSAQVILASGGSCTKFADAQGNFGFFVGAGTYTYEITYQGATYGPFTLSVGGAGGGSGITTLTGDVTAAGTGTVTATVLGIRNVAIPSLVIGRLTFNGTNFLWDNTSYLVNNQPITISPTGDVSGSATNPTFLAPAFTVTGLRGQLLPALSPGLLRYSTMGGWIFDTNTYYYPGIVPASQPCVGTNAASQFVGGTCSGSGITQLTGDTIAGPGSGSQAATTVAVNGTTIPINSAADQIINTTASAVAQWTALPNCPDTGGNHLNYLTSTHGFLCGTSSSGGGGAISSIVVTAPVSTFSVTPSSPCTSGACSFALAFSNQTANTFLRGPTSGGAATPTWGGLVLADLPALTSGNFTYTAPGTGGTPVTQTNQNTALALLGADYGMVCNGATDDTTALQNAVNALSSIATSVGPASLKLPTSGSACLINSPITVAGSNLEIYGVRGASIIKAKDNAWLPQLFNTTGSNIKVHDLTLDGNITNLGVGWFLPTWSSSFYYDKCGAGDSEEGGGPGGCASGITEGGPDVVANVQSGTLYLYQARTNGINQALPTTTGTNTYWAYLFSTSAAAPVAAPHQGGILWQVSNGSHVHFDNIEMKNGQFGIYHYATTASQKDITISNSDCHDFGVQYQGNLSDVSCVQNFTSGGFTLTDVHVDNNTAEHIFIPVTGPGNAIFTFLDASNVSVTHNHLTDSIQRGGGQIAAITAADGLWDVNGNTIIELTPLNGDISGGVEIEMSYSAITNNVIWGMQNCITATNLGTANLIQNALTGNTCFGQGSAIGGGFTFENQSTGQIQAMSVTGNVINNYGTGIYVDKLGSTTPVNFVLTPNVFDNVTTEIHDPYDVQGNDWTNYTPSVSITTTGGSATVACAGAGCTGQYKVVGKVVYIQVQTQLTYVCTACTGTILSVSLPVSVNSIASAFLPVQLAGTGVGGAGPISNSFASGTTEHISFTQPTSGTNYFYFSGVYQSQ